MWAKDRRLLALLLVLVENSSGTGGRAIVIICGAGGDAVCVPHRTQDGCVQGYTDTITVVANDEGFSGKGGALTDTRLISVLVQ